MNIFDEILVLIKNSYANVVNNFDFFKYKSIVIKDDRENSEECIDFYSPDFRLISFAFHVSKYNPNYDEIKLDIEKYFTGIIRCVMEKNNNGIRILNSYGPEKARFNSTVLRLFNDYPGVPLNLNFTLYDFPVPRKINTVDAGIIFCLENSFYIIKDSDFYG